jgi:hypothetical protein
MASPTPKPPRPTHDVPALREGERLSRAEFERRYQAMPAGARAELIEGVVHMPSPVRQEQHGGPHFDFIGWLAMYRAYTPGVRGGVCSTVRLDPAVPRSGKHWHLARTDARCPRSRANSVLVSSAFRQHGATHSVIMIWTLFSRPRRRPVALLHLLPDEVDEAGGAAVADAEAALEERNAAAAFAGFPVPCMIVW